MKQKTENMYRAVRDFIRRPSEAEFEPLALRVFAFQLAGNRPYRRYCESLGRTAATVASWRDIPAVPTAAFKEMDLSCGPPEKVFVTSGTTNGGEKPGRHGVPRLKVYRAAILPNFAAHLVPDRARLRMLILTGSPALWPHSSLAHMMEEVRTEFGGPGSAYYMGDRGLDVPRLARDLNEAVRGGEPVSLLGITLAFHQLAEYCREHRLRFRLPAGSRIMDTGGFKGRRIDLSKDELYRLYEESLGIPQTHIVNEYGMTEMGSQFYDNALADHVNGLDRPRHKRIPPWVRTRVLDPETLEEAPPGSSGLLRHFDLANCGSVMALQTEDIGKTVGDGFELIGRAEGAEARGCSLMIDELLKAQ